MEDTLAWHYDSKGIFSVKTAFRVFCDDDNRNSKHDSAASSSRCGGETKKVWSMILTMQASSRLEHFLWRLAHNSLALRSNLKRRGVKVDDDRCIMCNRAGEDGGHLFLKCKCVKALWRSAGLEFVRKLMAECCTTMEVVEKMLTIDDELQLKTALLNQVREGEKRRLADEIAGFCGRQAAEINNLQRITAEDT
ncbi:unnamed protein product [Miscanthus lutarioriparius]|uniref:Reverse transcriptase zinc-binding domain-containing protein n=1 Tax=Miscanthus lutarioriparius TaxID=422564 RepID=A0A811SED8_9POAL|nr:unnamed protein product [Miscanthus lutarioriparius]